LTVRPPRTAPTGTGQTGTGRDPVQQRDTQGNIVPPPGTEGSTGGGGSRGTQAGSTAATSGPTSGNVTVTSEAEKRQQEILRKSEQINRTVMRSICRGC
jgi:hypothetical protein